MPSSLEAILSATKRHIKPADILLILSALPIIILFVLAPNTFELSWAGFGKLGRGGLFFILFFLGFEILDFRRAARLRLTLARKAITGALVLAGMMYFSLIGADTAFVDLIYSIGRSLGAAGEVSNSWLMGMDYLAITLYVTGLAVTLFSIRAIKEVVTPIVLGTGMVIFYLLDAFFPYGEIGPLQSWANFIVAAVGLLSKGLGLPIYGLGNYLTIVGTRGFFRLAVYWPSVGVQSMIIYSLVMVVIAAKLDSPLKRKLIYALVGVGGTMLLNVLRIFAIAYYGYAYATTGQQLDAFHNSIGEILFPIWIAIFLVIVLQIENSIAKKEKPAMRTDTRSSNVSKQIRLRESNTQ